MLSFIKLLYRIIDYISYFPLPVFLFSFLRILSLKLKKLSIGTEKFIPQSNREYTLFITHNLGGGTGQYVQNYVSQHSGKNTSILLLSNFSYKKDYFYSLKDIATNKEYVFSTIDEIFAALPQITTICLNSLVSFYNWQAILTAITTYKTKNASVELCYFIHDYHCICPNYTLIWNKLFCNFKCTENNCIFDKSMFTDYKSIEYWRNNWNNFFSIVDKIFCFSASSASLVSMIYNNIDTTKLYITPHDMSYFSATQIQYQTDELHIGIIGRITSIPKGTLVVKDFLEFCKEEKIKVTIIGELEKSSAIKSPFITYYGSYNCKKLPLIIEKSNINVVFFPSIWPETFSYLVSELQLVHVPIIGFNIGAQGEKIKNYDKGFVCNNIDEVKQLIRNLNKGKNL